MGIPKFLKNGSSCFLKTFFSSSTLPALLCDLLALSFILIWLLGGIGFHGKLYFRNGADPRRVAIFLLTFIYFLKPQYRNKSFLLRIAVGVGRKLETRSIRWSVVLLFGTFSTILAIYQTLALRVPLFDVGLFHQILWSLDHGMGFHSTISQSGNFLQDHFSPTLALLVPLFHLTLNSPFFLPVLQVFLLFGGASAWVYLAERLPGASVKTQNQLAAATTVFIVGFGSLWGNLRWGFHENSIAFISLSWALAFLITSKSKEFLILFLSMIAALSKEILLLDVALFFGLWALLEWRKQRRLFPIGLTLLSILLISGFIYFEKLPHPADKNYFERYYSYLGNNLFDFAKNLIFQPFLISQNVGRKELLQYLYTVFSPWLFLPIWIPFVTRIQKSTLGKEGIQSYWIWIMAPSFFSSAIATYPPLRSSNNHYVLELWPLLAPLTLLGLVRLKSQTWIWMWAIFSLFKMDQDPIADMREFYQGAKKMCEIRSRLKEIPTEDSLIATELSGTWVAGRKSVTRWPHTEFIPNRCPDRVVILKSEFKAFQDILSNCPIQLLHSNQIRSLGDWVEVKLK